MAESIDSVDDKDPYITLQESEEFRDLRARFRRWVFPVTIFFLAWYFLYVFLAVFARDFMGHRLFGNITVGLILGLLQFVSTFTITTMYARWMAREYDPRAEALAARAAEEIR